MIAALFPNGINELVDWRGIWGANTWYELNKTGLIALTSTAICLFIFVAGTRRKALVPAGLQNVAEAGYEFVEQQIALAAIDDSHGDARRWTPFLAMMFFFIFFMNIWSTIPPVQFPATARIVIPVFLAVVAWVTFITVGFVKQGLLYPLKAIFPPGVPIGLYILVTPIEFVSKFLIRPFSLAIRLFANMVAGHVLISVFAIMTEELLRANSGKYQWLFLPLPFFALMAMIAFEILVALLQAYIFVTLTAVYIGESVSPDH